MYEIQINQKGVTGLVVLYCWMTSIDSNPDKIALSLGAFSRAFLLASWSKDSPKVEKRTTSAKETLFPTANPFSPRTFSSLVIHEARSVSFHF